MSQSPDPCYCEQACVYEDLLERVCGGTVTPNLLAEIRETLQRYKDAQAEYAEDSGSE